MLSPLKAATFLSTSKEPLCFRASHTNHTWLLHGGPSRHAAGPRDLGRLAGRLHDSTAPRHSRRRHVHHAAAATAASLSVAASSSQPAARLPLNWRQVMQHHSW